MIELRHFDVSHFAIEKCIHLANGCTTKCGCIGLILFHYLSFRGAIIYDINTIGIVSVCDALMASCATVHEPKWTFHVKRPSDVAQSYSSSGRQQRHDWRIRNCGLADLLAIC